MALIKRALVLVSDPGQTKWVCPLLFLADAALCGLVVWKIPYTEIDWKAYMQQVTIYLDGERDYAKIHGDTGPLVYPAVHVYIYRALHYLTDEGRDIAKAQIIFVGLYLVALLTVMQCYRQAKVPPYVFPLLILSKRLHSIFLLRLFNDCFAAAFLFAAVLCFQRRQWTLGSLSFTLGLGVKMSLLLALPAVGCILLQAVGKDRALRQAMFMGQVQILTGYPFLIGNFKSYLSRAFELTRQFFFKWTVNWRFVGEDVFLSKPFSIALLAIHAVLLVFFVTFRWLRPGNTSIPNIVSQLLGLADSPTPTQQQRISQRVTPEFTMTTMLSAMIIGCLCARSLHYQFYAYIAWSTPYLLWRSGLHPVAQYVVWFAQEVAWNVYPSTASSSAVVILCLTIAVLASARSSKEAGTEQAPPDGKRHRD